MAETIPVDRPWHDKWWERLQYPYIFDLSTDWPIYFSLGTVYSPVMEESIVNLRLEDMVRLKTNGTAKQKIIKAKTNADLYFELNRHIKKCSENCFVGYPLPAVPLCVYEKFQYELIQWLNEPVSYVFCGLSWPAAELSKIRETWQATMDASMDALEESEKAAEETIGAARKQYEELEYAGMCEQAYTYEGGDECREMKNAFYILDSGQQEAKYGQMNTLKARMAALNDQLAENANTTLYPTIMTAIWGQNGIIETFSLLEKQGKLAKEKAKQQYGNYNQETTDNKFYAEEGYENAKAQKLDMITEAITKEGFERGKVGTIAERWASLEDNKEMADYYYNNATRAYDSNVKNYILIGIQNMQEANQHYAAIKNESEGIIADAENVVAEKREKASAKIEETKKLMEDSGYGEQQINEKLKDAKTAFAAGEEAAALGLKYRNYVTALQLAASAAPAKDIAYEKDYQTSLAVLEELLKNAEKDGVYVTDLKAEFEFIKSTRPENELDSLTKIKNELETRIRNRFYDLENKRSELMEKLAAANATNLLAEMQKAEVGIVGRDGTIDWLAAAGRLKQLSADYDAIARMLEYDTEKKNDALANQLTIDASLIMGKVKIDQPTEISYIVTIANPKPYEGREVTVKVPLEGEFRLNYIDIKGGKEGVLAVQTDQTTMRITLEGIGGFERKTITFEKAVLLATTRSRETKAEGLGGGAAEVKEKTVFQLSVDNAQIDTEGKTNVLVDGAYANRALSKGIHTLASEYLDNDAYSEERTTAEAAKENGKTRIRYGIIVKPFVDLDKVPVSVEIGDDSVISNVEISCGAHRCIKQQAGQKYIIILQDVRKGAAATISVSYSIKNVSQFITGEIAKYENSAEPEIAGMASEAKRLAAMGDEAGALEKIEEIRKVSAALENERAKLLKSYYDTVRKIRGELEDLEEATEKAHGLELSTSEISKFMTRKNMLNETLEQNAIADSDTKEEMVKKLDELKSIDTNWLKKEVAAIAKKATADFSEYKKRLNGIEEAQYQLKVVEDDINVLLSTEKASDAVQLLYSLGRLEQVAESISASRKAALVGLGEEFDALRGIAEGLLAKYDREYKDAKSAGQDGLFSLKPEKVKATISSIGSYIKAGDMEKTNHTIRNELIGQIEIMNQTLGMLEADAIRKTSEIDGALKAKAPELSAEQLAAINKKIDETKRLLNAKSYAKAIAKATETIQYINSLKGNMGTTMYLIAASVVLIAIIAFFLYSKQKKKAAGYKLQLQKAEPKSAQ